MCAFAIGGQDLATKFVEAHVLADDLHRMRAVFVDVGDVATSIQLVSIVRPIFMCASELVCASVVMTST